MPYEQFTGFSSQNSTEKLVKTERTRENKPEENRITKREGNKVPLKTGEVCHGCPYCAGQNKRLFSASEHDLKMHLERLHNDQPEHK